MLASFIVDLKIREDDTVQILEFGPLQHAGFSGYEHVTGKDMREDVVYPSIDKNWHGDVVRLENPSEMMIESMSHYLNSPRLSKPLKEEHDQDRVMFIRPFGYFLHGLYIYQSQHIPGFEYMNGSSSFMMMCQNKAYLDFMQVNYDAPLPIMPEQFTLLRRHSAGKVDQLLEQVLPVSEYVIKCPDTAQGRGTMVVKRDEMEAVIKGICMNSARDDSPIPISSTWNHPAPLITIQEKVKSRPTFWDGKDYDGTMRVAMTVWRDEKGDIRHDIHDAYWKMPRNAIGEGDYQDQVISASPHYERLSDTFKKHSGSPETFAPVSDADKDLVFGQLAAHLPDFVAEVADYDMRREVMPFLMEQDDENMIALAAMTYADMHYDGFVPNEEKSDVLEIQFRNPENDEVTSIPYLKIPQPQRDLELENEFFDLCQAFPRGPVSSFLSGLYKRNANTNGYETRRMKDLTDDVRVLRRPVCSTEARVKFVSFRGFRAWVTIEKLGDMNPKKTPQPKMP